ncbi:GNAT family N-acetyltransferase [Microbacterium sp. H1-D42]|uniref:GNAT family N-acetyltransferase n=1 Tax=Microbacterium sp. H1-D42 TaxID=2925844 RepID=UPI001F52F794|nr:GNAT family N-acetyltransferase [Microbacterium sp. H1-D42]UNK69851.1 GNAT family N-acetyltransferase [Microbacterium sp. H1-D42]
MELRSAKTTDIEWLVELRAQVLHTDLERLGRYDAVRVRQRMRDGFRPESTRIIVFKGEDVGSISVREEPDTRWIEHFYIAPVVQNRGIGSKVLTLILAEHDPLTHRLNVLQGSPARRLYERHGFTVDSEDDVDVWMTRRGHASA